MTYNDIMNLKIFQLEWEVSEHLMGGNHDHKWAQDINASRMVLAEVERRGMQCIFTSILGTMMPVEVAVSLPPMWLGVTALPHEICRAALLACELEQTEN